MGRDGDGNVNVGSERLNQLRGRRRDISFGDEYGDGHIPHGRVTYVLAYLNRVVDRFNLTHSFVLPNCNLSPLAISLAGINT